MSKAFGDNVILKDAKAEIERGDKIALIGANGKGKSTLLRIMPMRNPITATANGDINVEESFYAQHQLEALTLENTILDEMRGCGSQMTDLELRALLGCFYSAAMMPIKDPDPQRGRKARVALAKTIVSKANFLMLDEPTNHLDMHSVDLLINALNRYEGTMIPGKPRPALYFKSATRSGKS
ncbi:ATP-binding cassette domain-containing protein [Niabella sp. CC-SYL272]|uniref:ATP-binding cassette domain-containing protein n=1 Tax=Niabella agricola TaxID=2891571 RepID=UPI001F3DA1A7|nr:ATP-binding cassette domain-containing protein [Niabella agricola]MCF3108073.1 ATP-binding cassette domain-containing protein [Niabella agricola]